MPNFVSPGVYIIEKDISDYPAQINSSVVGIVGFASRGPIAGISSEKATLITSQQGLIDTFGAPNEGIKGQALEGALEILEATNSLRFIRCADATRLEASAAVSIGGCPAILLSGTHAVPIAPGGYTPATARAANLGMSSQLTTTLAPLLRMLLPTLSHREALLLRPQKGPLLFLALRRLLVVL